MRGGALYKAYGAALAGGAMLLIALAGPASAQLGPTIELGNGKSAQASGPVDSELERSSRYVPKAPGTKETMKFYFGPYLVPPGHDMNRVDVELPTRDGFLLSLEPGMQRVVDGSEPSHQEAHIHHAHWFALDPGNEEDNYFGNNTEWIFGNGDEETKGDFEPRTNADPKGPVYGQFIGTAKEQTVIYMLHNKTAQPLYTYIVLDVVWQHGNAQQLKEITGREFHDVSGVLFGRTYDVPRDAKGDGKHEYAKESGRVVEWTSTIDGTIIGMGGHLHPGGKTVVVENYGSKDNPCPNDRKGYGGTKMLDSDAIDRKYPLSEDFQMEVTNPAFRAPLHKGDRIRISGTYENKDHAWYAVMSHLGIYVDEAQAPKGRCKPQLIGKAKYKIKKKKTKKGKKKKVRVKNNPTVGVPNRPWGPAMDHSCDPALPPGSPDHSQHGGGGPCERPLSAEPGEVHTNQVTINDFLYIPGDRSASGPAGNIPVINQGETLTFFNGDQFASIRHSVTTCEWPCNGSYVANYPLPDGRWDSDTLGYDVVDGGNPNPVAQTPPDLGPGRYSYFCRIHPWMRGEFKVQ